MNSFLKVVDTGGKWKKSSIIKVLIILFGHLWDVELTYRYIFSFKVTLRSQQPDIVPIIATGVVDTGSKSAAGIVDNDINNTRETGGKICHGCRWYRWQICRCCPWYRRQFCRWCRWHQRQICHRCHWFRWYTLTCEYLHKFSKKFETVQWDTLGLGGNWFIKNQTQKISWHCPFTAFISERDRIAHFILSRMTNRIFNFLHFGREIAAFNDF